MMQNNIFPKIAITGGYASGKTTVCEIFKQNGYLVFSADAIFADLLKNDDFVLEIYKILDIQPIFNNSKLFYDRKLIASIVFNDNEKHNLLNEFTHKAVYDEINSLYVKNKGQKIVFEIPLLFESKKEKDFDLVIVVCRNLENRISSGAIRDNISLFDAELRIKNQVNYDNINSVEHTYICNDGTLSALKMEVQRVIEQIEDIYS